MSKYLAIDLGASSGRIIYGSLSIGQDTEKKNLILTISEDFRFSNEGVETIHGLHWDYLKIYSSILEGLRTSVSLHGAEFDGIGVDTWGVDYVLLDKDGCPLAWPFHYRDDRTKNLLIEVFKQIPKDQIYSKTGIQFMELNTLTQLYAHRSQNTELFSIVDSFLMVPDYFNFLLTGIKTNEYTEACTSQLVDARTCDWALDLITQLGLSPNIFKEIIYPGNVLGSIHPLIVKQTGLASTTPVVSVASHDTNSAIAAVPCDMSKYDVGEWAFISSGTWSIMGVEVKEPYLGPEVFECNFSNEGGAFNTINLLKTASGMWIIQECKKIWEQEDPSMLLSWDEITRLTQETQETHEAQKPSFRDMFFDVDHPDFTHPSNMIDAIQNHLLEKYQPRPIPSTIGEISRIIYESMVRKYQEILAQIESITHTQIKILHIIGGGSKNNFLNQLIANRLQIPVIAGPVEATAVGNLLMQAVSRKEIESLNEVRQIVRDSFDVREFLPE